MMTRHHGKWLALLTVGMASLPAFGQVDKGSVSALGVAFEADNENSESRSAVFTHIFADDSAVNFGLGRSTTDYGDYVLTDDRFFAKLDHPVGKLGFTAGIGTWGDSDAIATQSLEGSLYWKTGSFRFETKLELMSVDSTTELTGPLGGARVTVKERFNGTGFGVSASLYPSKGTTVYGEAMFYTYDTNFGRERIFRRVRLSPVNVDNSLVDDLFAVGVSRDIGSGNLAFEGLRFDSAVDNSSTNSLATFYVFPVGKAFDLTLGAGVSDSDDVGSSVFGHLELQYIF
jgi:hypothetical protein